MARCPRWFRREALLAVAGMRLGFVSLPAVAGGRTEPENDRPSLVVEIRYGESLWSITRRHADPNMDIREAIWRIRQANHLGTGNLQPGGEITIPADCLPRNDPEC